MCKNNYLKKNKNRISFVRRHSFKWGKAWESILVRLSFVLILWLAYYLFVVHSFSFSLFSIIFLSTIWWMALCASVCVCVCGGTFFLNISENCLIDGSRFPRVCVSVCALVLIHEYMLDPFYGSEWVDRVEKIPIQILHYGCSGRRLFFFFPFTLSQPWSNSLHSNSNQRCRCWAHIKHTRENDCYRMYVPISIFHVQMYAYIPNFPFLSVCVGVCGTVAVW